MNTKDAKRKKLDPRFHMELMKAERDNNLSRQFSFLARVKQPSKARKELEELGAKVRATIGDIFTMQASGHQVKQMLEMDNVIYLEYSKPMRPINFP